MTVYEMAEKYYPKLWPIERLDNLLKAEKLTQKEYDKLVDKEGVADG